MKSEPKAKEISKRPARRAASARPRKRPEKSNPALEPIFTPPPEVFPEAVTKPPRAPLAGFVLALGVLLFLGSQVVSQFQIHTSLAWQVHLLDRQSFSLEKEIQTLQILESEGLQLLSRAEIVSQSYQDLLKDLLTLSDTDSDAMAVVSKFQIRNLTEPPAKISGESQR